MNATTIGVDLAKDCFQLAVADERYRVQRRERFTRKRFAAFMVQHPASMVHDDCSGRLTT